MRATHAVWPCLLVLLVSGPAAAPPARMPDFTDIVPEPGAAGDPDELAWSSDGHRLAFLWNDGPGVGVWLLTPGSGEAPARVLAPGGLPGDGRGRDPEALHWVPGGSQLLVQGDGDLYLLPAAGGTPRRLTATPEAEADPRLSPDGTSVAYVRGPDLYTLALGGGRERRLTRDGEEGITLNGQADWVYWEEIWGREAAGHWWSPDGRRIAYYRFDETPVAAYPLLDPIPVYPQVTWQKYPKAGHANPRVKVGVMEARPGARTVWMDTGGEDGYLARVAWHPGGDRLAIQRLNREQDRLDLLLCDAASGRCRPILTESWPTWINLGDDFAFLGDGRFIWGTEQDGWRRLDLHAADGTRLGRLTPEGWAITGLLQVSEAEGWLLCAGFRTQGLGAAERHILRVPLLPAGSSRPAAEVLTTRAGWNEALPAPAGGLWVHTWSDADHPPERVVLGPGQTEPQPLPSTPPAFDPAALPHWELFTIPGAEGVDLPARILRPATASTARRPAIMYQYGGPGSQVVVHRWDGRGRDLWHKMMASRGYVVLAVDNPASLFFGKRGEDRQHRRFGEINLRAQLDGAAFLGRQPDVDPDRIGLWGWSGGGANTLYCLLNRPGAWAAGVAGAPVTDWRLYDTIWTERYLDHPEANPEGYSASSAITYAGQLEDPLLVVHGTGDDNVHPQNTLALIRELVAAEKPFEDALYTGQKHGFQGRSSRHFYRRMTAFFDGHLGGPGAPEPSAEAGAGFAP